MNRFLFPIVLSATFMVLTFLPLSSQSINQAKLDQMANTYVRKSKNKSLVIGLIHKGESSIYSYGQLSRDNPESPNEKTIFEIGAVTQVFTTTLSMYESLAGKFDYAEPIQYYLPEGIEAPSFKQFNCVEITIPRPGEQPKKIRSCSPDPLTESLCISFCDLASHTSGLPNSVNGIYTWHPFQESKPGKDQMTDFNNSAFFTALNESKLSSAPGEKFRFSNQGMALLGNLLESITGSSYEELLATRITKPLNMPDTRLYLDAGQKSRLAPGHTAKGRKADVGNFISMAPAAGLKSTAADLVKFVEANLTTEHYGLGQAFDQVQQSRVDLRFPGAPDYTTMGYGWIISLLSEESNLPVTWLNGGTNGYRAFIGFMKDTNTGVVVLSNSAHSVDELAFAVLKMMYKQQ